MRSIFCGNLESDACQSDLERLFRKYGKVERVDMKSGFAFIKMEDERDADDAIRRLDRFEFGRTGRRLRVEWTKQERGSRRSFSPKRSSSARTVPSKTLFVINFDTTDTKIRDLEKHFDPYGRILNVRIRRNFAFVQYESQEDATKALEEMHMSKFMDRVISVKYAVRDDDDKRRGRDVPPERRGGHVASPERRGGHDVSPERRGNRDVSPERRGGRDTSPERRGGRVASPERRGGRVASPERRGGRDVAPERRGGRYTSPGRHGQGRPPRSPSLYRRDKGSPDYGHGSVPKSRTEPMDTHYGIPESPLNHKSRGHSPSSRDRSRS